jgi:hypothetical protein
MNRRRAILSACHWNLRVSNVLRIDPRQPARSVSVAVEARPERGKSRIGARKRLISIMLRAHLMKLRNESIPPRLPATSWLVAAVTIAAACSPAAPPTATPLVRPGPATSAPPCAGGRADCDGDPGNGCESALSSPASCGACGTRCGAGESCVEGLCRREHRLHAGAGACAIRAGAVHCWGAVPGDVDEFEHTREQTHPRRLEGVEDALTVRFNASMSLPICTAQRSGGVTCWPETPALLAGQAGIRDVAAYANDVCVVGATGQLRCGETELSDVPGVPDAVAVVASDDSFFALRRGGQVVHVDSSFGEERGDYVATPLVHGGDAIDLAAAYHGLCLLRSSGRVACSDLDFSAAPQPSVAERPLIEVPGLTDAVAIDVGCALRASGEAVSWVAPGRAPTPIAGVKDGKRIACGSGFGCYERADGAVLCWGSRRSGRLGDGAETTRYAPVPIEGITDARAVIVDGGSCALRKDGTVWCWGTSGSSVGRRGVPAERVPGVEGASSLTVTFSHACASGPGKPVVCFTPRLPLSEVLTLEGLGEVSKAFAPWSDPGVALLTSGEVLLFEMNDTRSGTIRPRAVKLAGVRDATDVALGSRTLCVLRRGGAVACAETDKVFEGAKPAAPRLVEVSGLRDATQLSGEMSVCALRRSGRTTCVKQSSKAGSAAPRYEAEGPARSTFDGAVRVSMGALSSCAITARGTVICRSQMGAALLGAGLREHPVSATPVKGVTDAVDVSIGSAHACAALATGRVVCWGSNDGDALGGGESPVSLVPIEVPLDPLGIAGR